MISKYSLCDRQYGDTKPRGISCDEEGVFIAGDVPLVTRSSDANGKPVYAARQAHEIISLLTKAYGPKPGLSNQVEGLNGVARYMTDGNWILAKIAAVQLRLPDVADDVALASLMVAEMELIRKCCSLGQNCKAKPQRRSARKRDVSDEPRVPGGQSGGGEWTSGNGSGSVRQNPLLVPAQAITAPIPIPFDLPLPPTEITPFPMEIPNGNIREPPVNPYPDRPDCASEWAAAYKFCTDKQNKGEFKPGYDGWGKDFTRCLLGQVSADCGGNDFSA